MWTLILHAAEGVILLCLSLLVLFAVLMLYAVLMGVSVKELKSAPIVRRIPLPTTWGVTLLP